MADIEMPDFDNMTPEEIQRWMESLAKKQGATEGLITAADMEIADIDPNSVTIDEPGYVPSETFKSSSMKSTQSAPKAEPPASPEPPKPAPEPIRPAAAVPPPTPPTPSTPPVTSVPPRGSGERVRLPTGRPEPPRPAPVPPPAASIKPPSPPPPEPAPAKSGGDLAWLESLAAGLPDDDLNLDFSDLPAGLSAPAPASEPASTESWLESLVSAGGELDLDALQDVEEERAPASPAASFTPAYEEPPSWLESLSRSAELDLQEDDEEEEEDLRPSAAVPSPSRAPVAEDPADWLASLSASGELDYEEEEEGRETPAMLPVDLTGVSADDDDQGSMEDIEQAIREGRVSPEQMQKWLDRQTDILIEQPEISLDDFYDPDAPPVPADIPDWLLEVGPPTEEAPSTTPPPALLESLFDSPPPPAPSAEMPDWLKADVEAEQLADFSSIFMDEREGTVEESEIVEPMEPAFQIQYDPTDTWAEAFDIEQDQSTQGEQEEPEWYRRNVNDPARIAAVEALANEGAQSLLDAALPLDEDLSAGQRANVPGWLVDDAAVETVEEEVEPVPDWLQEAADEPLEAEMPAWLVEAVGYEEPVPHPLPEPEPAPIAAVITPPAPQPAAPKPAVAISGDVLEALGQAREYSRGGELETGLAIYEGLIRRNAALDDVVGDLEGLVRLNRSNPAVYRVLGDGLMRQGKLQQALDTYREALNQL